MASAGIIVVVLEIILHVPVSLSVSGKNFLRLTVIYLVAAAPFFLTGLLFSVVFARETVRISRLYGADLCGGALACLAVVPLLNGRTQRHFGCGRFPGNRGGDLGRFAQASKKLSLAGNCSKRFDSRELLRPPD